MMSIQKSAIRIPKSIMNFALNYSPQAAALVQSDRTPDIVALECGGLGPFWQSTCDGDALAAQVPPPYALFSN